MLNDQAIKEFQQIYKKKFDKPITFNQAKEEAIKLLNFFRLIYKPIKEYEKH